MSTAAAFPPPSGSGRGLAGSVSVLAQAAESVRVALTPDRFAALTDTLAAELAVTLAGVAELASAGAAVGLGRVADSGLPAVEGFLTPGSWWRTRTRLAKDDANDQVRLAKRLRRHYAATTAAWISGGITGAHAQVIATGVDGVLHRVVRAARRDAATAGVPVDQVQLANTVEQVRAALETELLGLAAHWGPETLRVALEHAPLLLAPLVSVGPAWPRTRTGRRRRSWTPRTRPASDWSRSGTWRY